MILGQLYHPDIFEIFMPPNHYQNEYYYRNEIHFHHRSVCSSYCMYRYEMISFFLSLLCAPVTGGSPALTV